MTPYVVLGKYTQQGMRNIKNLANLVAAAEGFVASKGGRVIADYNTFGPYDFVFVFEMPRVEDVAEGLLIFGSQGDVTTLTMQAFQANDFAKIAAGLPG